MGASVLLRGFPKKSKDEGQPPCPPLPLWETLLLGHRTLKSALPQPKNKSMNRADFLHAGSDGMIFG